MEVVRHEQNSEKIERLYAEIIKADKESQVIGETQEDRIRRLDEYYVQQWEAGEFLDKEGNHLTLRDISRTIISELRGKVSYSFLRTVFEILPPEHKRAYNHDHDEGTNVPQGTMDSGSQIYFDKIIMDLDGLKKINHSNLTRAQIQTIFDKIYDVEQVHQDYCDEHNIALIDERKQNSFTGIDDDDPCKERVRMFEPEPREGILYEKMVQLLDTVYDASETVKKFPLHDLQLEIKCARAVDSLLWYFQFMNNKKFRRDSYGWAAVMKKANEYGTKAGAAKMTAVCGVKERERELDKKRKVTREELANNFETMPAMFMKFIEWHPYLLLLHDAFVSAIQPIRADLSIDLRTKLRFRKGTITKEQVLKLLNSVKSKKKEMGKSKETQRYNESGK